jgi:hypothetical protein
MMELATRPTQTGAGSCLATIFILLILLSIVVGSGVLISRAIADTANSAADVLTTGIEQRQLTTRTGIEWDGRVEIARIQADVDKKTSFAFVLFWVTRLLAWSSAIFMSIAAVSWIMQTIGGNHEQTNRA